MAVYLQNSMTLSLLSGGHLVECFNTSSVKREMSPGQRQAIQYKLNEKRVKIVVAFKTGGQFPFWMKENTFAREFWCKLWHFVDNKTTVLLYAAMVRNLKNLSILQSEKRFSTLLDGSDRKTIICLPGLRCFSNSHPGRQKWSSAHCHPNFN